MGEGFEAQLAGLLARGDRAAATTLAIRTLGPDLLGYLCTVLRSEQEAREVWSRASEELWRSIGSFRAEGSFKTFFYKLAWHTAQRHLRDPYWRRAESLSAAEDQPAASARSATARHVRTEVKDQVARLRALLSPEEQTLLVLRVDRDMSWAEVADVMDEEAPRLRKRFERIKRRLRAAVASEASCRAHAAGA